MVEQNVVAAKAIAQRAYVVNNGHIVYDGSITDLNASTHIMKRYLGV